MLTFFSLHGYPRSSLENELWRVATLNYPDALCSSEHNDRTVDRVPLVHTFHPFNTQIKRFLLQNFHILSKNQQMRDIFPQSPFMAYKRDLNLRPKAVDRVPLVLTFHPFNTQIKRFLLQNFPHSINQSANARYLPTIA